MAQSIAERRYQLIFGIEKSMRYHRRHAGFFLTTQKLFTFITALLGTGIVVTMAQDSKGLTTFLGFVVAALGTVQLVFDLEGKGRENTQALEGFSSLRTAINKSADPDLNAICDWENQRLALEAQFVAELDALNVDCHNQVLDAQGREDVPRRHIGGWQKLFIHMVSWQSSFPEVPKQEIAPH